MNEQTMMNHLLAWVREAIDESRATDSVIVVSALAAADAPPSADDEICRVAVTLVMAALAVVTGGEFGCCELDDGELDVWGEDGTWRVMVRP